MYLQKNYGAGLVCSGPPLAAAGRGGGAMTGYGINGHAIAGHGMTGLVAAPNALPYVDKDEYSPLQCPEPVSATQL